MGLYIYIYIWAFVYRAISPLLWVIYIARGHVPTINNKLRSYVDWCYPYLYWESYIYLTHF